MSAVCSCPKDTEASDKVLAENYSLPQHFQSRMPRGGGGSKHLQSTVGCCLFSQQQQHLRMQQHPSLLVPKHRPDCGWKELARDVRRMENSVIFLLTAACFELQGKENSLPYVKHWSELAWVGRLLGFWKERKYFCSFTLSLRRWRSVGVTYLQPHYWGEWEREQPFSPFTS